MATKPPQKDRTIRRLRRIQEEQERRKRDNEGYYQKENEWKMPRRKS